MLSRPFPGVSRYCDETSGAALLRGGEPIRLGRGNDDYTGSPDSEIIFGGAGDDFIHGGQGNDRLKGGRGQDSLYGDSGADHLNGGAGDDVLVGGKNSNFYYGGSGADVIDVETNAHDIVIYRDASESTSNSRDSIGGFDLSKHVIVDLHRMDADTLTPENDAFTWVGAAAFSGIAGELRYEPENDGGLLQGDVDGDGIADFEVYFLTFSPLDLTADNFKL